MECGIYFRLNNEDEVCQRLEAQNTRASSTERVVRRVGFAGKLESQKGCVHEEDVRVDWKNDQEESGVQCYVPPCVGVTRCFYNING